MSQDRSRSKLDGVRKKLFRFRNEYFCVRTSERRSDGSVVRSRSDIGVDAGESPLSLPLIVRHGRSHDGELPALTHGGRWKADGDGHRHSLPSRCVAIPESPDEEDVDAAMPVSADDATPDSTSASGVSTSTETDRGVDYDQFVRGLQSTTATAATRQSLPGDTIDIPAGAVRSSTRRSIAVRGATTPCCVARRSSEPFVSRFLGAKLIRTLRKTFSAAGLGKNDEVQDPSAETFRTGTSPFDQRSSYLSHADNVESMLPKLNEDFGVSEWHRLVSFITTVSVF